MARVAINNTRDLGILYNGFHWDEWNELARGQKYKLTLFNAGTGRTVNVRSVYFQGASWLAPLTASVLALIAFIY